jgi:hypothetical protein
VVVMVVLDTYLLLQALQLITLVDLLAHFKVLAVQAVQTVLAI